VRQGRLPPVQIIRVDEGLAPVISLRHGGKALNLDEVVPVVARVDGHVAAVAAVNVLPAFGSRGGKHLARSVVLGAAHEPVGKQGRITVVELGHPVAVVHVFPDDLRRRAGVGADGALLLGGGRPGVGGAPDPAVVADIHRLVGGAVVIRMEGDLVLVHVEIGGGLGVPEEVEPVVGDAESLPTVIGAEEVDSADPDHVRVQRVNGDDVIVPALGVNHRVLVAAGGDGKVAEEPGAERVVQVKDRVEVEPVVGPEDTDHPAQAAS